ncbi:MAG: carbamoyltransferase HypF [Armatimonadetes bacterium]|nr:carbamoyltransferase HypF [Armatimonadota bacterium]
MRERRRIRVTGIVQGVGFRPFVYALATREGILGHVFNNSAGVIIEIESDPRSLDRFLTALVEETPPLALIEKITWERIGLGADNSFTILPSEIQREKQTFISPDVCICDDCLREMLDPRDRRFRYPFINCTNCGPRFTIIQDVPYDRAQTTMSVFPMCDECQREYDDAGNRRFHAQPNACPVCGPRVSLITRHGDSTGLTGDAAIVETQRLLIEGAVVAIKGLGGYHLACDALNETAVANLRSRKHREDKPFALMAPNLETIGQCCDVTEHERSLLTSRQRPIVLLQRRGGLPVAHSVARGNRCLGFMLPYTPLHYLLLHPSSTTNAEPPFTALVMTSGNIGDEPIAYRDDEARERLQNIADFVLTHNRDIHIRCDDSVVRAVNEKPQFLRRSRGYAPRPVLLPFEFPQPVLAVGAHLKNTFCLVKDRQAFISHHIGDLENMETLASFTEGIEHFKGLFDADPQIIAHDMHPEYLSTKWARDQRGVQLLPVQHHHAHIVSAMVEHGIEGPVIGVSFDGTGYGTDGTVWGGEVLVANLADFNRVAHVVPVPLPGGGAAVREPWRMGAVWLAEAFGDDFLELDIPFVRDLDRSKWGLLHRMIEKNLNCPTTTSMGRLFDAVAALIGIRNEVNYEGQAAVELEQCADVDSAESYQFDLLTGTPLKMNPVPVVQSIVRDLMDSVPATRIASRFHNAVAQVIRGVCLQMRERTSIGCVALSGGVFQNMLLLQRARRSLLDEGFAVYTNEKVPPNDGGISLGQAAVAAARLRRV